MLVVRTLETIHEPISTQVLIGNILAYDISSVSAKNTMTGSRSISTSYKPNMERYQLVICDLADSLSGPISTIETNSFIANMSRYKIWTIVLTRITKNQAIKIDNNLKTFEAYLGLAQIDTGNPVHMELFRLIDGVFFKDGRLFYRRKFELDEEEDVHYAKSYGSSVEPILLDYESFMAAVPPSLSPPTLSDRGRLSVTRLEGKSKLTHQQRVAESLLDYINSNPGVSDVEFCANLEKESIEFLCEEEKIKNYLLNRNHVEGGAKANFFEDVLGIQQEDWRYLSDQIIQGMKDAVLFRVKNTQHGMSHGAFLMITGRNGRSAVIQTGWQIKKGESARLITAYPEKDYVNEKFSPNPDNVVSPTLKGDDRWSSIFSRAHKAGLEAAKNVVPTPLIVSGYSPIFEGDCGSAWIVVPDARKGMARWLRKNDIGYQGYRTGQYVYPDLKSDELVHGGLQSVETEKAYAKAFADVLVANGIKCKIESRFD